MARSFKHSPFVSYVGAESEKVDKQKANRAYRRKVHMLVKQDEPHREAFCDDGPLLEDIEGNDWQDTRPYWVYPLLREVSNTHLFAKDGRSRINPADHPKLMRK